MKYCGIRVAKKIAPTAEGCWGLSLRETTGGSRKKPLGDYSLNRFREDCVTTVALGASPRTLHQKIFQKELALSAVQRSAASYTPKGLVAVPVINCHLVLLRI